MLYFRYPDIMSINIHIILSIILNSIKEIPDTNKGNIYHIMFSINIERVLTIILVR